MELWKVALVEGRVADRRKKVDGAVVDVHWPVEPEDIAGQVQDLGNKKRNH